MRLLIAASPMFDAGTPEVPADLARQALLGKGGEFMQITHSASIAVSPGAVGGALVMTLMVVITVVFFVVASTNLWWALHAWRSPEIHEAIGKSPAERADRTTFSAIVPFRHEAESVVCATVGRLLAQTHSELQIVLSVGHDDPESCRIGRRLAEEHPDRIVLSIDSSEVKNKPKQLNTALPQCTGEFVTILDAESLAHPELLEHAARVLASTGSEVLQAGVQLVNHRTTWFSLRNCLEYFFWFRSRLHLHAQHGFIPLGGNTLFIRRALLTEMGGWDDRMLTEDCDLGVRISTRGIGVAVSYDARLVTREETPDTVRALVKQRSRWNQGFLQVLDKQDWRRLPHRRQRVLARYTLIQPYLQALTFAVLPFAIFAALFLQLPLALAMLTFAPLLPIAATLLFEAAALREFGAELDLPVGAREYARLAGSLLPYQAVLGFAAFRAMVRHRRGHNSWEKTPHAGNHLLANVPATSSGAA